MLHVHAAIHRRAFLTIIFPRRLLIVIATSILNSLIFRSYTLFLRLTKSLALRQPWTPSQVLRQFAICRKPTMTLKLQFPKLPQLSAPSASIFKYVAEKPLRAPSNQWCTAPLPTPCHNQWRFRLKLLFWCPPFLSTTPLRTRLINALRNRCRPPRRLPPTRRRRRRPRVLSGTLTTTTCFSSQRIALGSLNHSASAFENSWMTPKASSICVGARATVWPA